MREYDTLGNRVRTTYYTRKSLTAVPIGNILHPENNTSDYTITVDGFNDNVVYSKYYPTAPDGGYWQEKFVHNPEGLTRHYSYEEHYPFYFIKDHLGNIRETYIKPAPNTKYFIQSMQYYPSGIPWKTSTGAIEHPYRYNGKELVQMHGQDEYDSKARWYYPAICRTTTMDPLCEKYYNISPYSWCGNNPIAFVDIDGTHPVYDENGIFLGTDDAGLQGDAIVMDNKLFSQNMSTEMAEAFDLGVDYLSEEALFTLNNHFNNLSLRPDWDGYITFDEATNWYRYGNGENLYANLGAIDLSGLVSLGEKYVGQVKSFNLLTCSNSLDAGLVYGQITLVRHPNHTVRAYADEYNFEMHPWNNPTNWGRNIQTLIGGFVAGTGNPYNIYFYGNQTLQPKQP